MDISTLLGIIIGFALMVYGIGFAKVGEFIEMQSVIITVGGTLAAVIACFPLSHLAKMGSHMKILMQGSKFKPDSVIMKLVEMSQLARKNGLLALEEQTKDIKDPFFKRGVLLIVDAVDAETVRSLLESEIESMDARHEAGATIYDNAAAFAPGFGMVGTLIGLINMLHGMDLSAGSSSSLGTDMGTALITTFYGSVMSNLIFMPIAKKLRIRNDEEILYRELIVEGVIGILSGDNPKNLKERLVSSLSQKQQGKLLGEEGEAGGKKGKKSKDKAEEA